MKDLFENLGFDTNPFSRFSAEEEIDYIKDIYENPKHFNTTLTDVRDGRTRFIIGERGIGKSALMFRLKEELEKERVLTILIDRFDNFKLKNNEKDFLIEVIKQLVNFISIYTFADKSAIKGLSDHDKEKLTFFIREFFDTLSPKEIKSIHDNAVKYKKTNFFKSIINRFLAKPTNIALSASSEVISDTIIKSLGQGDKVSAEFYKKYVPELSIIEADGKTNIIEIMDVKKCKEFLGDIIVIAQKCGFNKVAVFFDKIDEYPALGGSVSNIAEFVKDITRDTELLHTKDIAFVFVIWSKVRNSLNANGLRFDKYKPIDITWNQDELKSIVEKRLRYFSKEKISISDIVKNPEDVKEVLQLANKSPRHLIMLLSSVYDQQNILDTEVSCFSSKALSDGYSQFIHNFDYPSLYPGKPSGKGYILNVINKILRLKMLEFEVKDWAAEFKIAYQVANNDIKTIREYALIREIENPGVKTKKYRVTEPRLRYAIAKGITKLGNEANEEFDF